MARADGATRVAPKVAQARQGEAGVGGRFAAVLWRNGRFRNGESEQPEVRCQRWAWPSWSPANPPRSLRGHSGWWAWLTLGLALTTVPAAAVELSSWAGGGLVAAPVMMASAQLPAGAPLAHLAQLPANGSPALGLPAGSEGAAGAAATPGGTTAAPGIGTRVVAEAVAPASRSATDSACRSMGPALVAVVCACVFIGSLLVIQHLFGVLRRQGWSLANALSEPTRLVIPRQAGWSESQGDIASLGQEGRITSAPVSVTLMEPSSSRLIATLGSIAILLLYLGFGVFALFNFGLTCNLPASTGAVTSFLYSGLALFAPYVANKISSLFRPLAVNADSSAAPPSVAGGAEAGGLEPVPSHDPPLAALALPRPSGPAAAANDSAKGAPAAPPPAAGEKPTPGGRAEAEAASSTLNGSSAVTIPPRSTPRSAPAAPPLRAAADAAPQAEAPGARRATQTQTTTAAAPLVRAAATKASPPAAPANATDPLQPAVDLIAQFEGFVDHAYPDPASGGEPWTIGYGFTTLDGRPVQPGDQLDQAQARVLLEQGVQACAAHLDGTIPDWSAMDADMRCALISFAWNLGEDFYGDEADFATITRVLRERDWKAVPQALLLYVDPGTSVTEGLLRRREAEGALWNQGLARLGSGAASVGPTPATAPGAAGGDPAGSSPARSGSVGVDRAAAQASTAAPHRFTNPLKVAWFDQLEMDDGQGWRDCFSASSAMLAAYWGRIGNEDAYNKIRQRFGDSTLAESQLDALRQLGLQANFRTDGDVAALRQQIDAGRPVAVGWLCDGPSNDPCGGGHWTVVIGYDATGFFMNDPYGNCDLVNGGYLSHHDGAGLHYSYENWVPRWRVGGSGGWMLLCGP